jgi:type II secretory pathway component GspD/PulD (secretin)
MRSLLLILLLLASCDSMPRRVSQTETSDRREARDPESIQVVPLRYAVADELAKTLNDLFDASARAAENRVDKQGGCVLRLPGAPLPKPEPTTRVLADARTNSLVIRASAEDLPRILELVARLDTEVR